MAETVSRFRSNGIDAHVVDEHLHPLPRSIIRRSAYELLDGGWRFEPDLEDRGLSDRSHEPGVWPLEFETA